MMSRLRSYLIGSLRQFHHQQMLWIVGFAIALVLSLSPPVQAFCGFFVAKAGSNLENTASQVVIAHSGDRSVFMMANDFQGDVKDFARIVPIPVIPTRDQVRIGDGTLMEKLSAFTAPRLAQYFDKPCQKEFAIYRVLVPVLIIGGLFTWLIYSLRDSLPRLQMTLLEFVVVLIIVAILGAIALPSFLNQANKARAPIPIAAVSDGNVTVEDQFTVGEYDVSLLSAEESDGLIRWLQQNDYQVSADASAMLQSYIDGGMKFFVVQVNLEEFQKLEEQFLRPIVLDYESDKFMLPIRLGTLNATDDQELLIHILSPDSFAETANYKTIPIPTDAESGDRWPSGKEVPAFVQDEFEDFYQAVFDHAHQQHGQNAVFLEYAGQLIDSRNGNWGKCDPCTVPPEDMPTGSDLEAMGAWWSHSNPQTDSSTVITRLHLRYNSDTFPEDLTFRSLAPEQFAQKSDIVGRSFPFWAGVYFQARYVIRRPLGSKVCISRFRYRKLMHQAGEQLADLTGWDLEEIRQRMKTERRLNALDYRGKTKLHQAISDHDIQAASTLISQGANVNLLILSPGQVSMSPLGEAIASNQPDMVHLLLKNGADVNARGWRGISMLQWAIMNAGESEDVDNLGIIQQLLDAGADVFAQTTLGGTVWDYAQDSNNPKLIRLIKSHINEQKLSSAISTFLP